MSGIKPVAIFAFLLFQPAVGASPFGFVQKTLILEVVNSNQRQTLQYSLVNSELDPRLFCFRPSSSRDCFDFCEQNMARFKSRNETNPIWETTTLENFLGAASEKILSSSMPLLAAQHFYVGDLKEDENGSISGKHASRTSANPSEPELEEIVQRVVSEVSGNPTYNRILTRANWLLWLLHVKRGYEALVEYPDPIDSDIGIAVLELAIKRCGIDDSTEAAKHPDSNLAK